MSARIKKEFGPGYDHPDRKFNLLAVILPTVLIIALAVILIRRESAPSSKVMRTPVVACPTQTCPPESTHPARPRQSARPAKKASSSPSGPSTTLALSLTGAMLSRASSAVTHAVVLSSA
jgi:hypothetical protein